MQPAFVSYVLYDYLPNGIEYEVFILLFNNTDLFHYITLPNPVYHIHALSHLPEHGVHAVKMGLRGMGDKELAAAGILSGMGHGECTCQVFPPVDLALYGISGTACAVTFGAAALDDEIGDDPMKGETIVESFINEFYKVCDRVGCVFIEQFQYDVSPAGFYNCFFHGT